MTNSTQFFSATSLLPHMLERTIGQLRRQGAGLIQLIILICLASVASHFPMASSRDAQEERHWHQGYYEIRRPIEPSLEPLRANKSSLDRTGLHSHRNPASFS